MMHGAGSFVVPQGVLSQDAQPPMEEVDPFVAPDATFNGVVVYMMGHQRKCTPTKTLGRR